MSGRAVRMPVSIVAGKDLLEGGKEVGFGSRSGFHKGEPGRGMGHDTALTRPSPRQRQKRLSSSVMSTMRARDVSTSISMVSIAPSLPRLDEQ